jgi:hypothetical protein
MKSLIRIAAILLALSSIDVRTVHAGIMQAFECSNVQVNPPDGPDVDRVAFTRLDLYAGPPRYKLNSFDVEHVMESGRKHQRGDQYRNWRVWEERASDHWSGVSVRNPQVRMIGSLSRDRKDRFVYVETIFRGNRVEKIITSLCKEIDPTS